MKLERTKNTARNAAFEYLSKLILLFFPFILRSVFIYSLSADYLGLNSLFSSVLMVLNMSELGFSAAINVHMYQAIAKDQQDTVNALLQYYKRVYRIVGSVIMGAGLLLVPFLPRLIHESYPPEISLTAVYLAFLLDTSISYFLFAYYSSLISAFQRNDLLTKANTGMRVMMYFLQISALLMLHNYYAYLAVMLLFTVLRNLYVYRMAKKQFPGYAPQGAISGEIKADIGVKVKGAVIGKVAAACRNSFDSVFVSMFLGLTATAIYGNYYYIMNTITCLMQVMPIAMTGGAGNSVALESQAKNYADLRRMDFLYMWLAGWCTVCLLCLYQPFMRIWMGSEMMLSMGNVVLFCLYFYILKIGDVRSIYASVNGLYWEARYITVAEAIGNISLNYLLGRFFGISGILWATILTMVCINFLWGCRIVFRYYFTQFRARDYILSHLKYAGGTAAVAAVSLWVCRLVTADGILGLLLTGCLCVAVPNVLFFAIYCKTAIYRDASGWMLEKAKHILKK